MKSLCFLLLAFGLLGLRPAPAQNRTADSLQQLLRTQPRADTTRVRRLHALILQFAATDAPRALHLGRQALALSRQLADTAGIGRSLLWLSILHRRLAAYDSARIYTRQAQELFARAHDQRREARACLELSLIDLQQSNLTSALTWALRGLALAEQARDPATQTQLRSTLGSIYWQLGDYEGAVTMLNKALLDGQQLGDQQVVAAVLNGLGSTYQMQQNWPRALHYFRRAAQQSLQMGDMQNQIINEIKLAEVYGQQGSAARALRHGLRARTLVHTTHDGFNLPAVNILLARAYLLLHRPDSAVALARQGLQLSQPTRSKSHLSDATEILSQAYAELGNYPEAYRYQRLYAAYHDTLSGENTRRQTSALRYGYALDRKQNEIELLNKDRQLQEQKSARQRQQLYGLWAGLAGAVLLTGLLWRNMYIKQRANRHLNEKNAQIARQRDDLTQALTELKATQNQLIQREKMAGLGELTAGIAHEIQNPLNFVNNFSEVSTELLEEFMEGPWQQLPEPEKTYATELLDTLTQNLQKITQHGQRADNIVKGMLQHAHASAGHHEPTDLNALVADHLMLAYQSFRSKNKDFSATLTSDLGPNLPKASVVPQDIGRVVFNLCLNGFYALQQRQATAPATYVPVLSVHTSRLDQYIQIRVQDNGSGMSDEVQQKIFQPFFTTKPPGEGTGLGLSLSYDIIVKGHNGTFSVTSRQGQGTEVTLCLPV